MLRFVAVVVLLWCVGISTDPAAADFSDYSSGAAGVLTPTGGVVGVWGIESSGRVGHRGRGSVGVVCRFFRASAEFGLGVEVGVLVAGDTVIRVCEDGVSGRTVDGPSIVTLGEGSVGAVVAVLVDQAMANLDVDVPVGFVSPVGGVTLPNIETWFWVERGGVQVRSASAGGVSASVRSVLVGVVFGVGDEGVVECVGGGTPFDVGRSARVQRSGCVHVFNGPSRDVVVDVTATWRVSWSASDGSSGVLGDVSRSSSLPLRVQEKVTVIRHA